MYVYTYIYIYIYIHIHMYNLCLLVILFYPNDRRGQDMTETFPDANFNKRTTVLCGIVYQAP